MTDAIHEQVSAFLDGELSTAESELLLKRFERDAELRATLGRYSLLGEALRSNSEDSQHRHHRILSRDFAERVSRALEQEALPRRVLRPVAEWLKPVAGGAIAAGVAAVALVSLRTTHPEASGNQMAAGEMSPPVLAQTFEPRREILPSDTVPRSNNSNFSPPPLQVINSSRLANFVMAHSEYSSPLGRRNVLTGLLAEEAVLEPDEPTTIQSAKGTPISTGESASR